MRKLLILGIAAFLLGACTKLATQPPPPTPQVFVVAMTPAVRNWQPALRACGAKFPELRLLLEETPTARLDLQNGMMAVRLGEPSLDTPYFAAQIGEEQIVVVVHPDNPLSELTGDALRSLYTGQVTTWDSLVSGYKEPVQAWSYPANDELHQIFLAALWNTNPPLLLAYQAPDPSAMLEAIAENPGAVGYLPASWLNNSNLSVIAVETEVQATLHQPVLLLSAVEPQGLARSLVSCLQAPQD